MRLVTKVETFDGLLHRDPEEAKRHVDRIYGEKLSNLAHRILRNEKYSGMMNFIDDNLEEFVYLKRIKDDLKLESEED